MEGYIMENQKKAHLYLDSFMRALSIQSGQIKFTQLVYIQFIPRIFSSMKNHLNFIDSYCTLVKITPSLEQST